MSSFPLTNSYFSRWLKPPTRMSPISNGTTAISGGLDPRVVQVSDPLRAPVATHQSGGLVVQPSSDGGHRPGYLGPVKCDGDRTDRTINIEKLKQHNESHVF